MWSRQLVAANDGNLSLRLSDGLILCTPTLVSKGFLRPELLPVVDLDGVVIIPADGGLGPSFGTQVASAGVPATVGRQSGGARAPVARDRVRGPR